MPEDGNSHEFMMTTQNSSNNYQYKPLVKRKSNSGINLCTAAQNKYSGKMLKGLQRIMLLGIFLSFHYLPNLIFFYKYIVFQPDDGAFLPRFNVKVPQVAYVKHRLRQSTPLRSCSPLHNEYVPKIFCAIIYIVLYA